MVLLVALLVFGCGGSEVSTTVTSTTEPAATTTTRATTTTLVTTTTSTNTTSTTTTTSPTTTSTPTTSTTLPVTTTVPSGPSQLIWKAETNERVVSLTFDAGSDRGFGEEILDFLTAQGINATFGMTGTWAESNPDLVQRMVAEGHTLMNHTYNHPHMETLTTPQRIDQLERTETIVFDLTGASMIPYFRPPYGAYNNQLLVDVGAAGYSYSIMWTVDSLGWKGIPASEVVERCLSGAEPGAIILLHVGAKSTDSEALPALVAGLIEAGYSFATIPELIP
ncbi:hypothetical protein BH23ACT4_BH23ACT4_07320 [soil metagenome]